MLFWTTYLRLNSYDKEGCSDDLKTTEVLEGNRKVLGILMKLANLSTFENALSLFDLFRD